MRTIEEITAAMNALVDGAADRSLTDEEVSEYGSLESELSDVRRDGELRARNAAYNSAAPVARPAPVARVTRDAAPYDMRGVRNRITGDVEFRFSNANENDFSTDLRAMADARDAEGRGTDAGRRVMAALRQVLNADVQTDDVNELNPEVQRQDMYVDQRDYRTPVWDLIGRGAPSNGVQPFRFPKFSSASGLVGDHTEGAEPASGSFVTTSQVVTPTALSGKASITREVWDMGGNPSTSGLIFSQMVRGYREGLESAAAAFLNTLTAATDITLTTAAVDTALTNQLELELADLQFTRGYDFRAMVLERYLYRALIDAEDGSGRKVYPILGPQNANGAASSRFRTLDIAGYVGVPSWALASTNGAANNSWLFDPTAVYGWATAPQRLQFPGTDQSDGSYAPVAFVDLAVWGYKAFANTDIGGVRQVIYDNAA